MGEPGGLENAPPLAEAVSARPSVGAGSARWPSRMLAAAQFGVGSTDTVVVGLAGFLIRGGIVLLAIPSAILPTVLGVAALFNVNALGIDGRPTGWLISIIVLACVAGCPVAGRRERRSARSWTCG